MIDIPYLIFLGILFAIGVFFGWRAMAKRIARAEIENESRERSVPEFASDDESKEMVIMTMEHHPELVEDMKKSKQNGDFDWINRILEKEDNITYLKEELERYGDGIF
ncbi:MAG TPA: hypothetical protein O0X27_04700, partial [Methanocorpusculum sp.]|nr:hypothetical protein [Methanocorpusculum sp.]